MSFTRLLYCNLIFHWRANCAVLLGVAVGTAVLTGALLLGDSLQGSLRNQVLQQLAWVDDALVSGRFIRQSLADELEVDRASPIILLRGSITKKNSLPGQIQLAPIHHAGKVAVYGVDNRFWNKGRPTEPIDSSEQFWKSSKPEVVLNETLASTLGAIPGDMVTLHLPAVSQIPRETLLGRRDARSVIADIELHVRAVIPDEGPGRFNLAPTVVSPRNAFLPLNFLQEQLGQSKKVNALLVADAREDLQETLRHHLKLDDWGLIFQDPESRAQTIFAQLDRSHSGRLTRQQWRHRLAESLAAAADRNHDGILTIDEVTDFYRRERGYLSLESRQMLLGNAESEAALEAAKEVNLKTAPTFVYLANTIEDSDHKIPYSIVAALNPSAETPLGPFLPQGSVDLKDDEIILADWKDSPLKAQPGSLIKLTYFQPEEQGHVRELTANATRAAVFKLKGRITLRGPASDPDLTPQFPGITDKLDIRDWDPPFPYDNKLISPSDEAYWEKYRTTPKAYITLAAGQKLWSSRFGKVTSIRLLPSATADLAKAAGDFRDALLRHLEPREGGLVFEPVRRRGLEASTGGADFRFFFLGFSGFLIIAAMLLVGLLFRLNLDRRAPEIGIYFTVGFRPTLVRRLLLCEGTILAAMGAIIGSVAAALYTWFLLHLLRAWWPGTLDRSLLTLHVTVLSPTIGYLTAVMVSVLTIYLSVRNLSRVSPTQLLAGQTPATIATTGHQGRPRGSALTAALAALLALVCLLTGSRMDDHELRATLFFSSGLLLLVALLAALKICFWRAANRYGRSGATSIGLNSPGQRLARLGASNAARNSVRSLLTVGLLAAAAFLIVAVECFHRSAGENETGLDSGTGGFRFLAESDLPIFQDLNTSLGRDQLGISETDSTRLQGVNIYSLRLRAGDDASCLNLFQARRPIILGVPHDLVSRGGFKFQSAKPYAQAERANPWQLLSDSSVADIPVFADSTTAEWMLKLKLGGIYEVPNEQGQLVSLQIAALLSESIFQSELLLSEENFLRLYPRHEGYNLFLIEVPTQKADEVKALLERALADRGFEMTQTADRLQTYLAVENTYLATFQALGGLGLLLGTLGLTVVLLRTVWERRGELALLRALGFRRSSIGWLIFSENSFLLLSGLTIGTAAALLAVAPHVFSGTGEFPWVRVLWLFALVLAVGLTAAAAAVGLTVQAPLVITLRQE